VSANRNRYTPTTQQGAVAQNRNRGRFARPVREHREPAYPCAPAPALSAEELAQQLANDEAFHQWAFEERHTLRRAP
jgi:hypothetical protein